LTFFAAFLFFAIAALLAMMSGDVGTVQSRIDVHSIPITPAQQKKHRYRLTLREFRIESLRRAHGASMSIKPRIASASMLTIARANHRRCRKIPYFIGIFVNSAAKQIRSAHLSNATQLGCLQRSKHARAHEAVRCKKLFHRMHSNAPCRD
jgi:hypothetical protein